MGEMAGAGVSVTRDGVGEEVKDGRGSCGWKFNASWMWMYLPMWMLLRSLVQGQQQGMSCGQRGRCRAGRWASGVASVPARRSPKGAPMQWYDERTELVAVWMPLSSSLVVSCRCCEVAVVKDVR